MHIALQIEQLFPGIHARKLRFLGSKSIDRLARVVEPIKHGQCHRKLAIDLLALIDRNNLADDGTMVVPAEYVEVVVTRRAT
jgi:hypothetical protein